MYFKETDVLIFQIILVKHLLIDMKILILQTQMENVILLYTVLLIAVVQ